MAKDHVCHHPQSTLQGRLTSPHSSIQLNAREKPLQRLKSISSSSTGAMGGGNVLFKDANPAGTAKLTEPPPFDRFSSAHGKSA
jgi:hypothetical protein